MNLRRSSRSRNKSHSATSPKMNTVDTSYRNKQDAAFYCRTATKLAKGDPFLSRVRYEGTKILVR